MRDRATVLAALAGLAWVVLAISALVVGWGPGGVLGLLLPAVLVAAPPAVGLLMMREIMRLRAQLARIEVGMGGAPGAGGSAVRRAQALQGGVVPSSGIGEGLSRGGPMPSARPGAVPRREPSAPSAPTPPVEGGEPEQPGLDLRLAGRRSDSALSEDTVLRALDFPSGPDDVEGLAAQRAALREGDLERLIMAAQDVLVLLADRRVFVDDLDPPGAPAEVWRAFAGGVRRQGAARLGAGATAELVEHLVARMRADIVFRDAAHHFLRLFDRFLGATAKAAQDDVLCAVMRTRSGVAFRLLGQAAGSFG